MTESADNVGMKIISGGQAGVDRGALDASMALGVPVGGWCPRGRRAEDGEIPPKYDRLVEARSADYRERTKLNVCDADCTILLVDGRKIGPGTRLTERLCTQMKCPVILADVKSMVRGGVDDDADVVAEFLLRHKPAIVNVAGSRESTNPGIQQRARRFMTEVLLKTNHPSWKWDVENADLGSSFRFKGIRKDRRVQIVPYLLVSRYKDEPRAGWFVREDGKKEDFHAWSKRAENR